jgi:phage pi2 protein 07
LAKSCGSHKDRIKSGEKRELNMLHMFYISGISSVANSNTKKLDRGVAITLRAAAMIVALFTTASGVSAESFYKTVDSKGKPSFSDRPLSKNSEPITVEVAQPDPDAAARAVKEQAESAVYLERRKQQQLSAQNQQAAQEAAQKQRAERCRWARYNHQTFADGGLIYYVDEQGKRVFFTAKQIEDRRAQSAAAMDSACGG